MPIELIRIPERGSIELGASEWRSLQTSLAMNRLIEKGLLSLSLLFDGRVRISASCYVGRFILGGTTLDIHEKVEGTLLSLLLEASRGIFRIERMPAPASEMGPLIALLVEQFVSAVRKYTSRGRSFKYTRKETRGSLVGGSVNMTRSAILRARGLGHLLVFSRNTINHYTEINRIMAAALHEIGRMAGAVSLRADDISSARGLSLLFTDCIDAELLFGVRDRFIEMTQALLEKPLIDLERDAIALAGVLLAHMSFDSELIAGYSVPRSWYLNLELLFETALRNVMNKLIPSGYYLTKPSQLAPPVFSSSPEQYRAHPDLLLRTARGVFAVGDVKYKNWEGRADAGDLYQLLIHTSALGGARSFLIFPHDRYGSYSLGKSSTGSMTWLFTIDVRNIHRDLTRLLAEIGVPVDAVA